MPITPLHIGIPGLIASRLNGHINISAAIIGSVLIDLDFFLYLSFGTPIHGNLHTLLGATILSLVLMSTTYLARSKIKLIENWFKLDSSFKLPPVIVGAILGTYSHVLLDSLIYNDMSPMYPITDNHLYMGGGAVIFYIVYLLTALTTITLLLLITLKPK